MKNQIGSQFFLPGFRSGLATFLCGTRVNPLGDKKCPADFGLQIFAVPWTTREVISAGYFNFSTPFLASVEGKCQGGVAIAIAPGNYSMQIGTLYGIGVGPGDPELITVKGARLLAECRHAFVPKARTAAESVALSIAGRYLHSGSRVHELIFPMTLEREDLS